MEKIFSKTDPDVLLAIIVFFKDFDKPRNEIVDKDEFIQGAAIRVNDGDRFKPHHHIWKQFSSQYGNGLTKAQEAWIVIRGIIKVTIYDFNNKILHISSLKEGDACFLLHGGHTFECIKDHTYIWELKTGPYSGQANDKIFIDE